MKRLLGLIGFIYLSVLAVVFYFFSFALVCTAIALSVVAVCTGIILFITHNHKRFAHYFTAAGITALAATAAIILYTNTVYLPVIKNYSGREISVSGYICDEITKNSEGCVYTIKTDFIDGRAEKLKIQLTSYTDLRIEPFDEISAVLHTYEASKNSLKSKRIFLKAYTDDGFWIEATGEKRFSPYSLAVSARTAMKRSLERLLPDDYSSLCKAVLLGDKQALSYDVQNSFSKTGTSFLIVVSGMHLAVVTAFVLFIVKKLTHSRFLRCLSVCITVTAFMAITGFTPSIVRAGVMLIITFCSSVFLRKSDALNSMGAAAILLTAFNPYAVGDIGLLMSFAATLGIVLWADRISNYILSKLRLKYKWLQYAVNLFSVSLSATIWVMPVTMLAFHRLSPLNVIVSVIAGPLVSVMIVCALIAALLYLCPFISVLAYPFALVCGLCGKAVLFVINTFAELPYASVNTDKVYFYIWLAVTVLLAVAGFAVGANRFYIKCAVAFSLITLAGGWAVFAFVTADDAVLTVYNAGSGVTASVSDGQNITLLSCGGENERHGYIGNEVAEDYITVDNIIIPGQERKYSAYQSVFINEFDVSNVLVYDKNSERQALISSYEGKSRKIFGGNVSFTLNISDSITDKVMNIDSVTYQYIDSGSKTLLFAPSDGNIADLPVKYRTADYLLTDGVPDNIELAEAKTIIFSGTKEQYDNKYNSFKELNCKMLCTANGNITVSLNKSGG